MTDTAVSTDLDVAPELLAVIDLGFTPSLQTVTNSLAAVNMLFEAVKDGLGMPPIQGRRGVLRDYHDEPEEREAVNALQLKRRSRIHVQRIHLGSPLEVLFTTLTDKSAPIAYAIAAFLLLERSIRLLMEWQRHRAAMAREERSIDALGERVARLVVEQRQDGDEVIGQTQHEIARALKQLDREGTIILIERVER